jgi:hypothetical protein
MRSRQNCSEFDGCLLRLCIGSKQKPGSEAERCIGNFLREARYIQAGRQILLDLLNATKYVHAEDLGLRQAAREQDKTKDDHQG